MASAHNVKKIISKAEPKCSAFLKSAKEKTTNFYTKFL